MGLGLSYGSSDQKSTQNIWGPQAAGLTDLYGQVQDFTSQPNPYLQQGLAAGEAAIPGVTDYTQQALPAWANLLQGGATAGFDPNLDPANQIAGAQGEGFDTYRNLMNPQGNPYLDAMAGRGVNNLYQNYAQNIAPGITQNAAFTGGMGGSRSGVAEGVALQGLQDTAGDYLTNLYGGQYQSDQDRALAAASGFTGAQTTGVQTAADIAGMGDTTALQALQQGPTAANLGFAAPGMYNQLYGMQQQPMQFASNIYGRPQVLGSSEGKSTQYGLTGLGK